MEKKVPEIRFHGFGGEWEDLVLGGNARFTKGQGYSKGDLVASGSPIILYGRLYTNYQTVITGVDTFVNEQAKSIKSTGGEVIVPASGESPEDISRASVVNEPNVILGGDLNVIYPNKKIDSTFLALAISNGRIKNELSTKAQGKSVVHIRNSDLASLNLILPGVPQEQIQIGSYFQKLDSLINQHQQKHDKLSHLKKAMLVKMFPKQGETVPEIRFKGFSGDWELRRLSELTDYANGKGNEDKQKTSGKYELINLNSISIGGGLKPSGKFIDESNRTLEKNDLVMVLSDVGHGDLLGRVALIPKSNTYVLNQRVALLRTFGEVCPLFLLYNINAHQFYFKKQGAGMSQLNISKGAVENFSSFIPKREEQIAIGNYFRKLDALINQHQQQITKLNNIKQACLSKMFV
ncbi:restriction endonuclease subunit S [Vibrio chagasii]|uniref:restriction endonuclease subunit S n=1 Tax=Vibrio chagasii TaxID=170679 RepID=UPI002284CFFD|nr:restriction endonuclease subunit S [Vibrio chagasii]MCY9829318.1 restriction endonuclease subunit S [Vibrio chagasii]